jgi:hypothetical protein
MLPAMRVLSKPLVAIALAAAVLAGSITAASADVDPASDVLLLQNVFVPYNPKVCSELKDQLRAVTGKAKSVGYPIKVAVIGSRTDLGGAPQFFGKPQAYAKFLGQELGVYGSDVNRDLSATPLLVVMTQGFGTYQIDAPGANAIKSISIPSNPDSNALARVAILAVPKVASANGRPVPAVKPASSCSKKGTSILVFAAPILLLAIGGLLLRYGLRPRGPREPEPEPTPQPGE